MKTKSKKNVAVTAITITIYIATIMFYILSLVFAYSKGKENYGQLFDTVTRIVSYNTKENLNMEKILQDMETTVNDFSDFYSLQIQHNESLIFSYPKNVSEPDNSRLIKVKTTTIDIAPENAIKITAAIYLLKPSVFFYKGRITFLILLAVSLFYVFFIIFFAEKTATDTKQDLQEDNKITEIAPEETIAEKQEQLDSENDSEEKTSITEKIVFQEVEKLEQNQNNNESEDDEDDFLGDAIAAFEEENKLLTLNTQVQNIENKDTPDLKEISSGDTPTEETSEKNINIVSSAAEAVPEPEKQEQGLFSPITGFGWESYTITRLDSELIRAASSETDIALFLIKINGLNFETLCGKEISKYILETVKFNDLVFNYQKDGCAAIFQNYDVDTSLALASEMTKQINSILKEFECNCKITIGISTRSLRLISASRIFNEAEQALKHCNDDNTEVVAFRVNSEKYRDYLANQITS